MFNAPRGRTVTTGHPMTARTEQRARSGAEKLGAVGVSTDM
jgi:hypothetical protein